MTSRQVPPRRATAAEAEERAELEELRNRAERTAHEAGQTLGELAERLAQGASPRTLALQAVGHMREGSGRALTRARGALVGPPGAIRVALGTVAVLIVLVSAAVAYRRMRSLGEGGGPGRRVQR